MTDELKERVKAMAVEAGGVPMRENCLDAEAFPWGVEMEIDALERFAQAVARECAQQAHISEQIAGHFGNPAGSDFARSIAKAIRARYGLAD